jgi:hypothetical protein
MLRVLSLKLIDEIRIVLANSNDAARTTQICH